MPRTQPETTKRTFSNLSSLGAAALLYFPLLPIDNLYSPVLVFLVERSSSRVTKREEPPDIDLDAHLALNQ